MKKENLRMQFPILQNASEKSLDLLQSHMAIKNYGKGEHLFLDKQTVTQVYFLLKGAASLYKMCSNNEKRTIFLHKEGDLLNEVVLDGKTASVNCEFLTDSQVLYVDRQIFLQACEKDFLLTQSVFSFMSLRIRRLYHQVSNAVNSMRGDKKIAARLWKLARDFGKHTEHGIEIEIPLSITQVAELIGSKRETVSRQIKILTEEGLILLKDKKIIIVDPSKLLNYINLP